MLLMAEVLQSFELAVLWNCHFAAGRMSTEDVIYLLILLLSIPFGHVIKLCGRNAWLKRLLSLSFGLFIVSVLVGRVDAWHSLVVIIGNYIIVNAIDPEYVCISWYLKQIVLERLFFFCMARQSGFYYYPID